MRITLLAVPAATTPATQSITTTSTTLQPYPRADRFKPSSLHHLPGMAHAIGKMQRSVAGAAKVSGARCPVPARPAAIRRLSAIPALRPELISASSRTRLPVTSRKSSLIVQAAGSNGSNGVASNRTPSAQVLKTWKEANAVCFDVDCTITVNDTLDLLAEFMGCGEAVAKLTDKAMDGTMNLKESLDERLKILNCKPDDIERFVKAHPPEKRLTPGIVKLVKDLQARGVVIYLITGGFREIMAPVAEYLGVPMTHVYANRMLWQWDELTLQPTRLVGFDLNEPTAHNQGKPQAIAKIRQRNPYNTVVMIGDGITDLEAVQVTGGADLFIGYGGVAERPAVVEGADWYITNWAELDVAMKRHKVAVVGSGAWATAAVRMAGQNTQEDPSDEFDEKITMWVYEEEVNGRKLTEIINETHENPKYLPGAKLPENVVANPDLIKTVEDADIIVICCPHQFVRGLCKQMAGKIKPGAIAISLIKGMRVRSDGPQLISQMVSRSLGIDCSVLMGANIADGIAKEELSEAVIGYTNRDNAKLFKKLFQRPYFKVNLLPDAAGAEMCGTLKNIVALGAGLVDGMGLGANSKAAILRQGLFEMKKFSQALYPSIRDQTFLESCGIADLVSTCYGGRNRRVAAAYMEAFKAGKPESFGELEARLLSGQKLQGVQTSDEVQEILRLKGWEQEYPLFTTINRIVNQQIEPTYITQYEKGAKLDISDQEVQEQLPVVLASGEALHSGEFNKKYGPLSLTL